MNEKSLQETFAPKGLCFGCGCLNDKGLKIKSFINKNEIVYNLEKPSSSKKYNLQIDESTYDLYSSSFTKNTEMKLRTIFPSSFFTNLEVNDASFTSRFVKKDDGKIVLSFISVFFVKLDE